MMEIFVNSCDLAQAGFEEITCELGNAWITHCGYS